MGFDYFSFGYYFSGFGSFSWLFILSCFWSARLYALLCWYFLQRTSHWFSSPRFRTWAANLSCLRFLLFFTSLVLRRYLSYSRLRNCRISAFCRLSVEFCPVFQNRSQRRRDLISLTLLLHHVAPGRARWNCLCFLLPFPLLYE